MWSQRLVADSGGSVQRTGEQAVQRTRARSSQRAVDHTVQRTVRHMLAMQAQDFAHASQAICVRTPGCTHTDVLGALAAGDVVRAMPMRGTLHFVLSEDLGWLLALTATRTIASTVARRRALELDDQTLQRAADLTERALSGRSMGRTEYFEMLVSNGIAVHEQRGYHIIFHLSQLGLVCWGPPHGTQQALVLANEWIRQPRTLTRDESLQELATRYFAARGAATVRDLAWWCKLTLRDAREAVAAASGALDALELDGEMMYAGRGALDLAPPLPRQHIIALPGFDEYLLGYQDRSHVLPAEHASKVVPGKNGSFLPIILREGRVVGTWRRGAVGGEPEIAPFSKLPTPQMARLQRTMAELYGRKN